MNKQSKPSVRRQKYSQEFRDEAVRLSVSSGKSVAQVARELGISVNTLHDWRRDARYDHRLPVPENERQNNRSSAWSERTSCFARSATS